MHRKCDKNGFRIVRFELQSTQDTWNSLYRLGPESEGVRTSQIFVPEPIMYIRAISIDFVCPYCKGFNLIWLWVMGGLRDTKSANIFTYCYI